ncbi:MAG: hypothetical protein QGI33_00785, partial [Candidatus Brocadiia bacterium]|nr:hypothetical protein [Candidatus Brocadiia bacterium]
MNSSRLSKLSGALRHYRFIDYATQGYVLGMGLLVLVLHNDSVGFWPGLVAAHLLCVVLVHLLIRTHAARPPGRLLDILRHFYPVILYTALYRETGTLNQMLFSGYLDAFFMSLEERVFGMQPAVQFMERLPYLPVSELFYASYFSYYIMIVGIGAALYFRDKRQFFHYVSLASFSFYACFFIYILLPVIGPRVFFDSECAMK